MVYSQNITLKGLPAKNLVLLRLGLIMALLIFSGCSSVPPVQQIKVVPEKIDRPKSCYAIPRPTSIDAKEVKWIVVTPKTYKNQVLFALTPNDYEDLAENQAEFLRWIREAMWRLKEYEKQAYGEDND